MEAAARSSRALQPYVGLSVGLHVGAAALMLALAPGAHEPPLPNVFSVALIAPPAAAPRGRGGATPLVPAAPPPSSAPPRALPPSPVPQAAARPAPKVVSLAPQRAPEPAPRAPEPAAAPRAEMAAVAPPAVSSPGTSGPSAGSPDAAAGSGAGGSSALAPGGAADAFGAYIALVRARIQAERRYSPMARRRGLEGVVTVRLQLDPAGKVSGLDVEDGAPLLLSKATQEAVARAGPFPPPPDGLGVLRIPVRYRLTD